MKVITKAEYQINGDGTLTKLSEESHEYSGPIARCFGGDSDTTTNVTTQQSGAQTGDNGLAISGLGDVDVEFNTTDLGAVQGAFDFTQDFANNAFRFANTSQAQAANLSERALETSRATAASAVTGGASDLASINSRTMILIAAAAAVAIILPRIIGSK